jgi:hypothetical protein
VVREFFSKIDNSFAFFDKVSPSGCLQIVSGCFGSKLQIGADSGGSSKAQDIAIALVTLQMPPSACRI